MRPWALQIKPTLEHDRYTSALDRILREAFKDVGFKIHPKFWGRQKGPLDVIGGIERRETAPIIDIT